MTTPVWPFTSADIRAASTTWASASNDVAACIVVNGSRVLLPDGGSGGGIVTTENVTIVKAPYALKGASFGQVTFEGTLNPLSNPGDKPTEFQIVTRVTTTTTKQNGCILTIKVVTEKPFRAVSARYLQNQLSPTTALNGVFLDAGAVAFDTAQAYAERYERLQVVSIVETTPEFTGAAGELERRKIRTARHFNPPAALTSRSGPGDPVVQDNVFLLGGGAGVQLRQEGLFDGPRDPVVGQPLLLLPVLDQWFRLDTTVNEHEGGYLLGADDETVAFALTEDGIFSYDDADSKRSEFAEVRPVAITGREVQNSAIGGEEGSHLRTTEELIRGETAKLITSTVSSYLPAVELCSLDLALRNSAQPVVAVVCAAESHRPPVVQVVTSQFVETVDEGLAYGIQLLRDLAAVEIVLPIPCNGPLAADDPVVLDVPQRFEPKARCWVASIAHEQAERARDGSTPPVTATATLKYSAF